ncbi:MAG: hypothetical protein K0M45_07495 [Candidatus Paracaedibacteraceae bacterium]|nr:hypothetical protein [Candidatus Paracaedibacteraceae bacterium]
MDVPSLAYTLISFVGVIIAMIAVLYGIRWVMHKTNLTGAGGRNTDLRVTDRVTIDTKRQLLRLKDKTYEYVILLGDTDLLLDKKPHEETVA